MADGTGVERYDAVIGGAGPGGSICATLLAWEGLRVALVDPRPTRPFAIGECLPDAGVRNLRQLGLSFADKLDVHRRIRGVHSRWSDQDILQDTMTLPGGGGWRLDRARFEQDLLDAAVVAGTELHADRVRDIAWQDGAWRISTDRQLLRAHFAVDATGRSAWIARRLGAEQTSDAPQIALWATGMPLDKPMDRTLIESLDSGWWYGAMLPDGSPLAAFHCHPSLATQLVRAPELWHALLAKSQVLTQSLPLCCFADQPLQRTDARGLSLDHCAGEHWFAIGDAAISFDPIASQGFCNAIATAAMAARAILAGRGPDDYNESLKRIRERYTLQISDWYAGRDRIAMSAV